MSKITERLLIENFFTIVKFDWEIKDFNIITGGMASGKSLCLKLLQFLERVPRSLTFFPRISRDTLEREIFYNNISKRFDYIFHSKNQENDYYNTRITYSFKVSENNMVFDLNAKWNNDKNKFEWQSNYIDNNIDKWRDYLKEQSTPDIARIARLQIKEQVEHDFLNFLPVGSMFIPASRAIASIVSEDIDIPDDYLSEFINFDKQNVLDFNDVSDDETNKILHLNKIAVKEDPITKEKTFSFESLLKKEISSLELSSGQQELIILLLLIKALPRINFNISSIFIEEPCAHLFPQEQKDTIEYFAKIFRFLKDKENRADRFFITTHSPYILNVVNNLLKKGGIIKRNPDMIEKINNEFELPYLYTKEITASFINKDGTITDLIDYDEEIIFADEIANISSTIFSDNNELDDLNNKLLQDLKLKSKG